MAEPKEFICTSVHACCTSTRVQRISSVHQCTSFYLIKFIMRYLAILKISACAFWNQIICFVKSKDIIQLNAVQHAIFVSICIKYSFDWCNPSWNSQFANILATKLALVILSYFKEKEKEKQRISPTTHKFLLSILWHLLRTFHGLKGIHF